MLRHVLGLIYPRICALCERDLGADGPGWVCSRCVESLPWIEDPVCCTCGMPLGAGAEPAPRCHVCRAAGRAFDRAASGMLYRDAAREMVHRLKYRKHLYLAGTLAVPVVRAWRRFLAAEPVDAVLPVPLYPRKQREREFNQAEEIAAKVAREIGVPLRRRWLRRVRDTDTQTDLNAVQRRENVNGAFAVAAPSSVRGERLLLVDDVFTTGSTLGACAAELAAAGARRVLVATSARG